MCRQQFTLTSSSLKPQSLELTYLVCSITLCPFTKILKLLPPGQDWPRQGAYQFFKGKSLKKILLYIHKAYSLDVWYIVSPYVPLPSL